RAIRELKSAGSMSRRVQIRSSKYLNNVVEQDHRRVKQRIGPMLGFKRFDTPQSRSAASSCGKDQEGSVQDWKASAQIGHSADDLGGCPNFLTESTTLKPA